MRAEELLARLLYRDGLMLIIDKPAGLPVHAGPGGGPNLEQDLDALRFGLRSAPALAHRLDRDTSGCLILGRQRKGLSRLGKLFAGGLVEKTYWAVTVGVPTETQGRIEQPLKKITHRNGWKVVVDPTGQSAVTDYRVLGTGSGLAWIEAKPHTGRTHQIRVHLATLGTPILGDRQYGDTASGDRPMHLLARAVTVPLYANKPAITAQAQPPRHMQDALRACGWRPDKADEL
jgi:tRNA pseudouridine32 synthase/23S rRNA pseudouridine746 synthase/23S rRNA pseudouridine1911/1915/1917 synthase